VRAREVPAPFHATRSAVSKLYRYRIVNQRGSGPRSLQQRYACRYRHRLDVERMRDAARHFLGTQSFKAMTSGRSTPRLTYVRTVLCCEVLDLLGEIRIDVRGSGFLYHQVRNMVGTLLEVGRGRWPPECVPEILASEDRQNAGPTAPACGLCLQWVEYPPDHLLPAVQTAAPASECEPPDNDAVVNVPGAARSSTSRLMPDGA